MEILAKKSLINSETGERVFHSCELIWPTSKRVGRFSAPKVQKVF